MPLVFASIMEGVCVSVRVREKRSKAFGQTLTLTLSTDDMDKPRFKDLIKKLLHIEDRPERTALAFSIGVFLGFSPFLGLHTLAGLLIAFVFRMNRVAVLLGVWTNTPWFLIPYYVFSTRIGMWILGYEIEPRLFRNLFALGVREGFIGSSFWKVVLSQSGLLLSFGLGSLMVGALLALLGYPVALSAIRYYRHKRGKDIGGPFESPPGAR
jgi:uncharacterized protein